MTERLPAAEIITRATKRLWNLRHGAGDHSASEREREVSAAQDALHEAHRDQRREWISAQK